MSWTVNSQQGDSSFLELNFTVRELALITASSGRRAFTWIYVFETLGSLVYSIWLLLHVAAAIRRKDLTAAEILACLFIICSALFLYDLCRFSAVKQLINGFNERDVGQWARRRLSERRFDAKILRDPFSYVRGTIFLHVCLFITMVTITALVPVV